MKDSNMDENSADSPSNNALIYSDIIRKAIEDVTNKLGLSEQQIIQLMKTSSSAQIPVSIFSNTKLSGLELVCLYLKDELNVPFSKISKLTNRNYRTIWTSYKSAGRKLKGKLIVSDSKYFFPITVLADRNLSVLEAIVSFMKDKLGLKLVDIARELHRDQRNIWTVYKRANAKNK